MADREQSHTSQSATDEKPQRRPGTGAPKTSELIKGHQSIPKDASVGRDIPDVSKEKNTEIAVEAGRKGQQAQDKR